MTLAQRMAAGEKLHTAWSGVPDALTVEMVAKLGFDAVVLDMQHGAHHEDSVVRCLPAVLARNAHAIVRIPVGRFDMASRALDFGAEAVIAPMVNTIEDAKRFAAAMKYPPIGERSWGPTFAFSRRGGTDFPSWLKSENGRTAAFAMIETREALAIVDDILAIDGIDGVFVGPSDFSIAWTRGESVNGTLPDMMEGVAHIAARAGAAGKLAAIYVVDPAMCGRFAEMGYRLYAHGAEARYMAKGADQILAAAKASLG
ncbi:MAG: 2,4-dihydroxyhept-2-ene-1,7-dioic acid aldolase [Rhizobiaceae bacterium]|nr:2,4-dihydroxyhept-2-ene-1,7-dioic acid aldolase [Rhizobiaceae bacterium]MCV0408857.1 2,4-dihydroxyhept-2-ene-1,7-dioic acid aldolase [Rhizobiaceae bacterium]